MGPRPCGGGALECAALDTAAVDWLLNAKGCSGTRWAVLTTINGPTPAVQQLAEADGWCIAVTWVSYSLRTCPYSNITKPDQPFRNACTAEVISDLKGPARYDLPRASSHGLFFLNASLQKKLAADRALGFSLGHLMLRRGALDLWFIQNARCSATP